MAGEFVLSETPFSITQKFDMAMQMGTLFTGLSFESTISILDVGTAFIGSNTTTAILNALDPSIVGLTNVPSYRLSVEC